LIVRVLVLVFLGASAAVAGEYAVLSTGFRVHAQSHVKDGDVIRLQTENGQIELQACQIAGFEQEDYTPPATPPAAVVAPPAAPVAPAPTRPADPRQLVTDAAMQAGLPPELVHSLVRAESAYQPNAVSPKGAIGLMQLMPSTAAALNANPYDPKQNVEAGVAYLRELLVRYEADPHQVTKALAAYNAGPGAVDKYNGIPPYPETINYVNRVVRQYLSATSGKDQ
jgi:soluble lytic murein transglycosylase-like protein